MQVGCNILLQHDGCSALKADNTGSQILCNVEDVSLLHTGILDCAHVDDDGFIIGIAEVGNHSVQRDVHSLAILALDQHGLQELQKLLVTHHGLHPINDRLHLLVCQGSKGRHSVSTKGDILSVAQLAPHGIEQFLILGKIHRLAQRGSCVHQSRGRNISTHQNADIVLQEQVSDLFFQRVGVVDIHLANKPQRNHIDLIDLLRQGRLHINIQTVAYQNTVLIGRLNNECDVVLHRIQRIADFAYLGGRFRQHDPEVQLMAIIGGNRASAGRSSAQYQLTGNQRLVGAIAQVDNVLACVFLIGAHHHAQQAQQTCLAIVQQRLITHGHIVVLACAQLLLLDQRHDYTHDTVGIALHLESGIVAVIGDLQRGIRLQLRAIPHGTRQQFQFLVVHVHQLHGGIGNVARIDGVALAVIGHLISDTVDHIVIAVAGAIETVHLGLGQNHRTILRGGQLRLDGRTCLQFAFLVLDHQLGGTTLGGTGVNHVAVFVQHTVIPGMGHSFHMVGIIATHAGMLLIVHFGPVTPAVTQLGQRIGLFRTAGTGIFLIAVLLAGGSFLIHQRPYVFIRIHFSAGGTSLLVIRIIYSLQRSQGMLTGRLGVGADGTLRFFGTVVRVIGVGHHGINGTALAQTFMPVTGLVLDPLTGEVVTQRLNGLLRHQNHITDRALLALGQAGGGTGRLHSSQNLLGMTVGRNLLLRYQRFSTHRALLTFGQTGSGTGRLHGRKDLHGVLTTLAGGLLDLHPGKAEDLGSTIGLTNQCVQSRTVRIFRAFISVPGIFHDSHFGAQRSNLCLQRINCSLGNRGILLHGFGNRALLLAADHVDLQNDFAKTGHVKALALQIYGIVTLRTHIAFCLQGIDQLVQIGAGGINGSIHGKQLLINEVHLILQIGQLLSILIHLIVRNKIFRRSADQHPKCVQLLCRRQMGIRRQQFVEVPAQRLDLSNKSLTIAIVVSQTLAGIDIVFDQLTNARHAVCVQAIRLDLVDNGSKLILQQRILGCIRMQFNRISGNQVQQDGQDIAFQHTQAALYIFTAERGKSGVLIFGILHQLCHQIQRVLSSAFPKIGEVQAVIHLDFTEIAVGDLGRIALPVLLKIGDLIIRVIAGGDNVTVRNPFQILIIRIIGLSGQHQRIGINRHQRTRIRVRIAHMDQLRVALQRTGSKDCLLLVGNTLHIGNGGVQISGGIRLTGPTGDGRSTQNGNDSTLRLILAVHGVVIHLVGFGIQFQHGPVAVGNVLGHSPLVICVGNRIDHRAIRNSIGDVFGKGIGQVGNAALIVLSLISIAPGRNRLFLYGKGSQFRLHLRLCSILCQRQNNGFGCAAGHQLIGIHGILHHTQLHLNSDILHAQIIVNACFSSQKLLDNGEILSGLHRIQCGHQRIQFGILIGADAFLYQNGAHLSGSPVAAGRTLQTGFQGIDLVSHQRNHHCGIGIDIFLKHR